MRSAVRPIASSAEGRPATSERVERCPLIEQHPRKVTNKEEKGRIKPKLALFRLRQTRARRSERLLQATLIVRVPPSTEEAGGRRSPWTPSRCSSVLSSFLLRRLSFPYNILRGEREERGKFHGIPSSSLPLLPSLEHRQHHSQSVSHFSQPSERRPDAPRASLNHRKYFAQESQRTFAHGHIEYETGIPQIYPLRAPLLTPSLPPLASHPPLQHFTPACTHTLSPGRIFRIVYPFLLIGNRSAPLRGQGCVHTRGLTTV